MHTSPLHGFGLFIFFVSFLLLVLRFLLLVPRFSPRVPLVFAVPERQWPNWRPRLGILPGITPPRGRQNYPCREPRDHSPVHLETGVRAQTPHTRKKLKNNTRGNTVASGGDCDKIFRVYVLRNAFEASTINGRSCPDCVSSALATLANATTLSTQDNLSVIAGYRLGPLVAKKKNNTPLGVGLTHAQQCWS